MEQINPPKAGDDVRDLWKPVAAAVKVCNNLANATVNPQGTQNKVTVADGKITIELNAADVGGGGSGGASNLYVFAGTVNGQVAYFLISCDGKAYSVPPPGYTFVNPP